MTRTRLLLALAAIAGVLGSVAGGQPTPAGIKKDGIKPIQVAFPTLTPTPGPRVRIDGMGFTSSFAPCKVFSGAPQYYELPSHSLPQYFCAMGWVHLKKTRPSYSGESVTLRVSAEHRGMGLQPTVVSRYGMTLSNWTPGPTLPPSDRLRVVIGSFTAQRHPATPEVNQLSLDNANTYFSQGRRVLLELLDSYNRVLETKNCTFVAAGSTGVFACPNPSW